MALVIGGTSFTNEDILALLRRDVSDGKKRITGDVVFARILRDNVGGTRATCLAKGREDYRRFKASGLVPRYAVVAIEAIMCAGK